MEKKPKHADGKLRVYVAGSSINRDRARAFCDRITQDPRVLLTYDWIADVDAARAAGVADHELGEAERVHYARRSLRDGIRAADLVIVLVEKSIVSMGTWAELGYAVRVAEECDRHDVAVLVVGGERRSIFTAPGIVRAEIETDEEAAVWVRAFCNSELGSPAKSRDEYVASLITMFEIEHEHAAQVLPTLERVADRLVRGAEQYGDASFRLPIAEHLREISEELLDVIGWSWVAWVAWSAAHETATAHETARVKSIVEGLAAGALVLLGLMPAEAEEMARETGERP